VASLVHESELLLEDRLAPITSRMGFIETECQLAVAQFLQWQTEIKARSGISVGQREVRGGIEEVLLSLLPLRTNEFTRCLFIPTSGGWTAYVGNGYRGTDQGAVIYLAKRLNRRTVWVVAKPHSLRRSGTPRSGRQGALIFEAYGPESTEHLGLIRRIRLQNDAGKWEFFLDGTPFPFERRESYNARRKIDRFTFEMLKQYLGELKIRPFERDYFLPSGSGRAVLVEFSGKIPPSARDVSLAEARKLNGIDD
jgi:hypothetical protein